MIEKLKDGQFIRPLEVAQKVNELIEAVNKLSTSPFVNEPYTERVHEDDGA